MGCGTEPERTVSGIGMELSHALQYSCRGSCTNSQIISSPISLHTCLSGRHLCPLRKSEVWKMKTGRVDRCGLGTANL